MSAIKINKDNFNELVKNSSSPMLLDFYADWCGPCRMMSGIIDEIADEHPEIVVGKINVDSEPELAEEYGVVSIPMFVIIKDGKVAEKLVGARPKADLVSKL